MSGNCQPVTARRRSRRRGRTGSAMILVLLALAIAFTLGVTFLAQSSTITDAAATLDDHGCARHIAESGLMMATNYVQQTPHWRLMRGSGTDWINDYGLEGGTVTVHGEYYDDPSKPLLLTATGRYGRASHVVSAAIFIEHVPISLAVDGSITLANNARIRSFNSSDELEDENALAATNETSANEVSIQNNSHIYADVYVGVDGDPDITISHPEKVTGMKGALYSDMFFPPPVAAPEDIEDYRGKQVYTNTETVDGDRHYQSLEITADGDMLIEDHVIIRVDQHLEIRGTVVINEDASLQLYVQGEMLFAREAEVNSKQDPGRLVIFGTGTGQEHVMQNRAAVAAILDAPGCDLKLQNDTNFYGALMVRNVVVQNNSDGLNLDRNPQLLLSNPRLPAVIADGVGTFRIVTWNDR